jgi:ATP-dependent Lhr-like helicase
VNPVIGDFHFAVRTWFERRFGRPSRAQELGWPAIGSGVDVLLCAPTGSGKTLAAFMWSINRLVTEAEAGALRDEVSVLYVSPLKALANDIRLNLEEPLEGVRLTAAEQKLDLAEIRAGLRTGDTAAHERGAMLRRPPHILVTTPESLFILLTSPRFREKLRAVRYVIVDELHALAGNKRGAHLAVTLERLERMVRATGAPRPVRIGLSATLNPIEDLAAFLCGGEIVRASVASGGDPHPTLSLEGRGEKIVGREVSITGEGSQQRTAEAAVGVECGERRRRQFRIVRADDRPRPMDLKVIASGPELGPLATHPHWEAVYDRIAELVREHRTTLVFTLSRRLAERVALNLQKRLGVDAVMAHHGSLARKERFEAEQRLKRGELKALVATASLELGIDVGAVDLVCQVDSPKSIATAIQRIGRSGHALDATPKGRLFALTLDDLIECAAVVRAIRRGRLDAVEIPRGCLDVAAQQIVAIAAEEGEISESELLDLLRSAHNFASLTADDLRRLLEEMTTEVRGAQGAYPKIFYDRIGGRIRPRRGARLVAITSGGTIPESGNYDVVIESQGRKIGDVEEDFAQESSRGDVFALGSMSWQIQRISRGRLMVEPAPGAAPSLPFWETEAAGRTPALSAEVCELRREIAARLDDPRQAAEWLATESAVEESAAAQVVAYIGRGFGALGTIPDERTIVAERFFDGLGGTQIVIHAPFGMRVNRAFGLALRKRLCQSFDFEIQASAIDDGVLLALHSRHSFMLETIFTMLDARTVRDVLIQALLAAPMFEVRFRRVATRALSVHRNARGRKVPAWIQRLRAQDLMVALFPQQQACFENRPARIEIPDHFIVREALRECLEDSCDLPRLVRLLEGLENGSISTRTVDSIAPSVFAHRLLTAWDYSFLDDGERANRRSRTVAMNRGMAEEVFRKEDLSQMLAADAVEQATAEATGTAPARRARDRDELYELIRVHGALAPHELADRVVGDARAILAALEAEGRIVRARMAPDRGEVLVATEDAGLFAAAYPGGGIVGGAGNPVSRQEYSSESAREEIVRRALKTSGPTTVSELASRLNFSAADIERVLVSLEASGEVFRGRFTCAVGEQWCERNNLEKIHRLTLAGLRAEIEPCEDYQFAAFRLRWNHIGGEGLAPGTEGVATVLEQLEGMAFPPELWEQAIIPARVPNYRPEYLDQLCVSGKMAWAAFPDGQGEASMPARVAFFNRRHRIPWSVPNDPAAALEPKDETTWQALLEGGAQYLDEVADRGGVSERDALGSLWRLAALGRATNDTFTPLRLLANSAEARRAIDGSPRQSLSKRDASVRARLKSSVAGRWSAIGERRRPVHEAADDGPRALALMLLNRNGILTREMIALESIPISWSDVAFTLRRLEYAGTIRRGYFVRSLSGEQYALPEALDMLRAARAVNPARAVPVALSAADPANPYGAMLPGCGIARESSNVVVLRGGKVVMGLGGRGLIAVGELDDEAFGSAVAAVLKCRLKLRIDTIDGRPALESERTALLASMRFHSDGRSLVYDGLPGPVPGWARAR